jgi:hypothetical protein
MTNSNEIPQRVIDRAMAAYPAIEELVAGSTPVVSFGNPATAKIITIGINPSSSEFQKSGKSKDLLPVGKKRLVDQETLGINNPTSLTREQAIQVIEGCYDYFFSKPHNPYMTWFKHLNQNVNKHFGLDYRDASAAHLDLVQWATDPVWGGIKSDSVRAELLKSDAEFLRYQVGMKNHDIVFMNGSQVTEQLLATGIVEVSLTKETSYKTKSGKPRKLEFYRGKTFNGSLVLGWSRTFPGHYISEKALPAVVQELQQFMDEQTK